MGYTVEDMVIASNVLGKSCEERGMKMDRLTTRIEDKVYYAKGKYAPSTLIAEMEKSDIRDCMGKLAEYEDIGMTPNEIKYFLKDFGMSWAIEIRKLKEQQQEDREIISKMAKRIKGFEEKYFKD